jgi:IS5 family transposase
VGDIIRAALLLPWDEEEFYGDSSQEGIEERATIRGKRITFRVAQRKDKRRALAGSSDIHLLDLVETSKAHLRAKVEHGVVVRFEVILQQPIR